MRTVVGNCVQDAGYAAHDDAVLPEICEHPDLPIA
jgi:hypothetical protein